MNEYFQGIINAATLWVNEKHNLLRTILVIASGDYGKGATVWSYADYRDVRNMLYEICVNDHDFYCAVKEAIKDYETEKLSDELRKNFEL